VVGDANPHSFLAVRSCKQVFSMARRLQVPACKVALLSCCHNALHQSTSGRTKTSTDLWISAHFQAGELSVDEDSWSSDSGDEEGDDESGSGSGSDAGGERDEDEADGGAADRGGIEGRQGRGEDDDMAEVEGGGGDVEVR
jgi:hypothetical protein